MSILINQRVFSGIFHKYRRFIHFSASFDRRPPHHSSLFRKLRKFPYLNVYYDNDGIGPFEVKEMDRSKLPPGKYGSMEVKNAWKMYKEALKLNDIPTYFGKLQSMTWTEYNCFYHSLNLPLKYPETVHFAQFITRTKIMNDIPDSIKDSFNHISSDDIGEVCKGLKMHLENYFNQSAPFTPRYDVEERHRQSNDYIGQIMDAIVRSRRKNNFFENYSTSPNCIIETFMKRSGYERLKVPEMEKDADGFVKYGIKGQLAWQLRSRDPLKEFIKVDDTTLLNDDTGGTSIPLYDYHPKMFDLDLKDCESFSNTPFIHSIHTNQYARNVPGYWGQSPFKVGDPCAFSVLGVLNTDLSRDFQDGYRSKHPEIIDRHHLSEAILAGFTWTMAQAQNQGFTVYNEITYPFCCCMVLTDGHQMQMVYYQLNSTSSLWKPEDANLPANAIWVAPKINLFDIDSSGTLVDINDHAIHQILASFAMPKSDLTTREIQPYLQDVPARDMSELMIHFDKETATENEIEKYNERSRHMRIFRYSKSHPNRIFYFDQVKKSDLDEEFRQQVPGVDNVPFHIDANIKKLKLKEEMVKRGKKKALPEPSKWQ